MVCRLELEEGCYCAVGFPYEKRCLSCRNRKNRIDDGYCVCVPVKIAPRYEPELHDMVSVCAVGE